MFTLTKKPLIGLSITPNIGLEMAQIDPETHAVIKYITKPLLYNCNTHQIADMDTLRTNVMEMFEELLVPQNSDVILNVPTMNFKIGEYPAMMDNETIYSNLEEEYESFTLLRETEKIVAIEELPSESIQVRKVICTPNRYNTIIELAMLIRNLGYNVKAIRTSICSTLNALLYTNSLQFEDDSNWIMAQIDGGACHVLSMQGNQYIDCFEEPLQISEVLGVEENYNTVVSALTPIVKNLPAKYLFVISKTDLISAEELVSKINYDYDKIYLEDNCYTKQQHIETSEELDNEVAKSISLDVIGAAADELLGKNKPATLNLFNKYLGIVYTESQPPVLSFMGYKLELTVENVIKPVASTLILSVIFATITFFIGINCYNSAKLHSDELASRIEIMNKFLKENKELSTELFDEGIEIGQGVAQNKNIYSYYTILGTDIPLKLWLTHVNFGKYTTIEGEADNLESIYGFFRNIKDYNPQSDIKLQKLSLASSNSSVSSPDSVDSSMLLTTLNADFYTFKISNAPEEVLKKDSENGKTADDSSNSGTKNNTQNKVDKKPNLPELDPAN